ncbi:tRNA pseudouridine(38-40) synthase TruA [Fuchsiella alkaliacetigena]|uniref:tRNA pseudouridine(38-40) synthase TruA n=1 Tax=Fuchsiella alkaliacetigena TaxID=957042 RepID=UPI00200AC1AB|nr:tRNA pseudouridine(38-40) synthase TruA [Fuchsiella alkaliacetigena]MCK8824379.1 tRNA pseudouridine(38-40) synthase TruA [Fuchsiella alkaliacetigena]
MRNLRALVEYDGTNYHGFQRQPNAITIQEVLETSLADLTGEDLEIIGASRTDSGVHALAQVVNFKTESPIPIEKFAFAWTNVLPDDILIKKVEKVSWDFHARYFATGKIYEYHILNQRLPSVFERNYTHHIKKKLNYKDLVEAADYLVGTYDFTSFQAAGCGANTTVRTINSLTVQGIDSKLIFRIEGDAFLYKMVRNIVGTLIEIGQGKLNKDNLVEILAAKDRTVAGPTAPACGLRLIKVKY